LIHPAAQALPKTRRHLQALLARFDFYFTNISRILMHLEQSIDATQFNIKAVETFLTYPSALILGQKNNALMLSSPAERLKAVNNLYFPKTLKQLKTYL
jgi:hypothetical protein